MNLLLLVGSAAALTLAIVHSWRTRGRAVTLAFFLSGLLFGVLRGNAIWLVCRVIDPGAAEGLKPYIPQEGFLPPIGHESIQVAVGWVFAAYLAWTVAELILRRLPGLAGRIYMIAGLSALFMAAIGGCMETAAVAVGWWYWDLPTHTALFRSVNVPGMEAWFSVVPDFLLPFLVIVCSGGKGDSPPNRLKGTVPFSSWRWLWLAVFPLHMLGHMLYRWTPYAYPLYNAMELLVLVPALLGTARFATGELRDGDGSGVFLAGALAIFFGVIASATALAGRPAEALAGLPMLMMCLLAWKKLPLWAFASMSLAGIAAGEVLGPPALWSLAPLVAFGFLMLLAREKEDRRLNAFAVAVALGLIAFGIWSYESDRRRAEEFAGAWKEGDRLALAGDADAAGRAWARAETLRPREIGFDWLVVEHLMEIPDAGTEAGARLFGVRLGRLVRELETLVARDPDFAPPRLDLAELYLVEDNVPAAASEYRDLARMRPKDRAIAAMSAYLALREKAGDSDEAIRELRRPKANPGMAVAVNSLGAFGAGLAPERRVHFFLEAAQFDPDFLTPEQNLARACLVKGSPVYNPSRALWHARRAVAIARTSGTDEDRAESSRLLRDAESAR